MNRETELRQAVAEALDEGHDTLGKAAADELMRLWGDLAAAIRYAHNDCWSLDCEDKARRIAVLTRAISRATPWQEVEIELLETGIYQWMHDLLSISYEPPDMAVVAQMRAERAASLTR